MPDRYDPSPSALAEPYSPQRRTALVLTGTGTAGAYHAGVLRALHEAGVKLDIVAGRGIGVVGRSEEHTSELQSLAYLVCSLLLEKKTTLPDIIQSTLRYIEGIPRPQS